MNKIFFSTQSTSVDLFYDLSKELDKNNLFSEFGFFVNDKLFYKRWIKKNPLFENYSKFILKEWQVYDTEVTDNIEKRLREYENILGPNPGLFGSIVADRRIFMGPNSTFQQDYRRRFSDYELKSILLKFLMNVDDVFKKFDPDIIVVFQCVTIVDYLLMLFSKHYGKNFLNLKPTKVDNRITFTSTINDPSPEFKEIFTNQMNKIDSTNINNVREYISRVRSKKIFYEGVVKPSVKTAQKTNLNILNLPKKFIKFFSMYFTYLFNRGYKENYSPDPLKRAFYLMVVNKLRARFLNFKLRSKYINSKLLKNTKFVFFPLHTEPEVSLLVYGKPFINQTELIRMIAINLPINYFLVVKEHPWMVGKRKISSYLKMLNIPNVLIVRPDENTDTLIKNCSLVSTISSSVALEAVINNKPVITFGKSIYNILPNEMVYDCKDLRSLAKILYSCIHDTKLKDSEKILETFLSSIFLTSDPINLYSSLLKRQNAYRSNRSEYKMDVKLLAKLLISNLDRIKLLQSSVDGDNW